VGQLSRQRRGEVVLDVADRHPAREQADDHVLQAPVAERPWAPSPSRTSSYGPWAGPGRRRRPRCRPSSGWSRCGSSATRDRAVAPVSGTDPHRPRNQLVNQLVGEQLLPQRSLPVRTRPRRHADPTRVEASPDVGPEGAAPAHPSRRLPQDQRLCRKRILRRSAITTDPFGNTSGRQRRGPAWR